MIQLRKLEKHFRSDYIQDNLLWYIIVLSMYVEYSFCKCFVESFPDCDPQGHCPVISCLVAAVFFLVWASR